MLTELCKTFGYHRNHAIRVLTKKRPPTKKGGRPPVYPIEVVRALERIWVRLGYMCSKILKQALPEWLPFFDQDEFPPPIQAALLKISHSTIDRLLAPYKARIGRNRRSGTRLGFKLRDLQHQIPLANFENKADRPGFIQGDTVAHCGGSMAGDFAWSLTITDAFSGWTDCRATWTKTGIVTVAALKEIQKDFPFAWLRFNVDNGSEFLNATFADHFGIERDDHIVTRSRPYKKNDNCHVEQKNFTHVREIFGYSRIGHPAVVPMMNEAYRLLSLLQNLFVPQLRLKEKIRQGARYKRSYDKPLTPYHRLMASAHIPEETKQQLLHLRSTLNPLTIRQTISEKIRAALRFNITMADDPSLAKKAA